LEYLKKISLRRITAFIATFAIVFFLLVEFFRSYLVYAVGIFDFDRYQVFEATTSLLNQGFPSLSYLPNSSAGLDILYWSHLLLPFIYSIPVKLFTLSYPQLELFRFIEIPLLTFLLFKCLRRFLPFKLALIFTAIAAFDSAFLFISTKNILHRWSLIFAYLSFLATTYEAKNNSKIKYPLAGAFSALSALAFFSIGLPIFIANTAYYCITYCPKSSADKKQNWSTLINYLTGSALVGALCLTYLLGSLGWNNLLHLLNSISSYGVSLNSSGISAKIFDCLNFLLALTFGHTGPSILPVGLLSLLFNWQNFKNYNSDEKFITKYCTITAVTWIGLALLAATHFYAARMSWILPFSLLSISIAIQHRHLNYQFFNALVLNGLFIGIIQLLNSSPTHLLKDAFWAQIICLMILCFSVLRAIFVYRKSTAKPIGSNSPRITECIVLIVLINCAISFKERLTIVQQYKNLISTTSQQTTDFQRFSKSVKSLLAQKLHPNDLLLTNFPASEFVSSEVRRQIIFFYRGLFSGATKEPAALLALFHSADAETINGYSALDLDSVVYYRGHCYKVNETYPLPSNLKVFLGQPTDCAPAAEVKYSKFEVAKEQLTKYLATKN